MNDFFDGGIGGYDDTPTTHTDTAQICLKGHVINSAYEASPELNKKYCPEDGEATITECPHCHARIAGRITYSNVWGSDDFQIPSFCIECGKAYPWTENKIAVAQELAKEIEGVKEEDVQVLERSIVEISKNDAQAQLGATRIKKILASVGGASVDVLKGVIVEVASSTAKKVLLGQ